MSVIVFAIIVLIICGLLVAGLQYLPNVPPTIKGLIICLVFVLAALAIANRYGVL